MLEHSVDEWRVIRIHCRVPTILFAIPAPATNKHRFLEITLHVVSPTQSRFLLRLSIGRLTFEHWVSNPQDLVDGVLYCGQQRRMPIR
jgi:hypothetical protein